jgi:hypothetical protein
MLILLDIDGVMIPATSWKKPEFMEDGFPAFDIKATKALQRIIDETNASIILTTSHKAQYSVLQWKMMFNSRGVNLKDIQRLGTNSFEISRKDEILDWYNTNFEEKFVIIDDDKVLNSLPANLKANLILTSSTVGLTDDLASEAISILKTSLSK